MSDREIPLWRCVDVGPPDQSLTAGLPLRPCVPLGSWLRGPLKEWVESLINEDRLIREGHFYAEPIRKKWSQHLAGTHDWTNALWSVLMFQTWKEKMDAD